MDSTNVTKSEMTQEVYLKRAATFVVRAAEYFGREKVSCCDIVEWLGIIKPSLRKASWRMYRSSFNFYLEKMEELKMEGSMEDIQEATRNLAHIKSANEKDICHPPRTSSGKKKGSVALTPERKSVNVTGLKNWCCDHA